MIRKHPHILILIVLFYSSNFDSANTLDSLNLPMTALKHNEILGLLKALNFQHSDCLQIVVDENAIIDPTIYIDNSIPYLVRGLSNMLNQNIHDYDVQNIAEFAEQRPIMNYFQCNLVLVYPNSQSSLNRLFLRSNKIRFYSHTILVVIGLEIPNWNQSTAKFIRQNALYLLFLNDRSNQIYSMTRHGMILENSLLTHRSDPSVGQLFGTDEKDDLRISSFEYAPYVIYLTETK